MRTLTSLTWFPLLTLTALTAACAGGGSSSSGGGTSPPGAVDLTASLGNLGVNTAQTPRQGEDGSDLDNFSPLGSRWDASSPAELLLVGIPHETAAGPDIAWLDDASDESPSALWRLAEADAAWVHESENSLHGYRSKRAFASADLDADGRDEVVALRSLAGQLYLEIWEDTLSAPPLGDPPQHVDQAPTHTQHFLGDAGAVTSVALCAGDFDGDTEDELLVGYTTDVMGVVEVYDQQAGGWVLVPGSTQVIDRVGTGDELSLVLAAGNHDQDQGFEAVVVMNEYLTLSGKSHYTLIDDADAGFAVLESGLVQSGGHEAVVASAAFGDVDADGIDELILGGLTELTDDTCAQSKYLGVAFEDLAHGGGVLGSKFFTSQWQDCEEQGFEMEYAHVLTADLDGDMIDEVVINRHLFELDVVGGSVWRQMMGESPGGSPVPMLIPEEAFFADTNSSPFTRGTSTMTAGDQMVLGKDQIQIFRQDLHSSVNLYGDSLDPQGKRVLKHHGTIETGWSKSDPDAAANPIILSIDTDDDGITMVREESDHEVVFTEPIILAVLAAPPSVAGIDQNYGDTATTFGNTTYQGEAIDASMTIETSAFVGLKVNGGVITQSGFEMKGTVHNAVTMAMGTAYSLSETVEFTTGPLEDSVVFSCIPMDRYTYRIVRHTDEAKIDEVVVVDLPRKPVTLQVEREFYNENIQDGSPRIDEAVLVHSVGDLDSYPNKTEKSQLLQANPGLSASSSVGVGAGSGSSSITLEYDESSSYTAAIESGFTFEMETTAATVSAGFSVGASFGSSFQATMGHATTYSGTVGDIAPADFPDNHYQYGLFTYYHEDQDSGQSFQVVNYWVE